MHSRYVEERLRDDGWAGRVWRVPLAAPASPLVGPPPLPRRARPLIVSIGHLNPAKRIPELLQAFTRLHVRHPEALLVLAGAPAPGFDVAGLVERHGLEEGRDVVQFDYVTEDVLWQLLGACDICVALRLPTMGETSAVAVHALALGRPLVVTDVGWFSELPDEAAVKIQVGADEVKRSPRLSTQLASRCRAKRGRMGEAALEHARREHALDAHRRPLPCGSRGGCGRAGSWRRP